MIINGRDLTETPGLGDQHVYSDGPDQRWLTGVTEHLTAQGELSAVRYLPASFG